MEITEVRVSLRSNPQTRLKAYATLTFDNCFVVRNVKIIEGKNGLFIAMPSRKPTVICASCQAKTDLGNRFCNHCGAAMPSQTNPTTGVGESGSSEAAAHRDIAHPITVEFRQYLQKTVLEAYEAEKTKGPTSPPTGTGDYGAL